MNRSYTHSCSEWVTDVKLPQRIPLLVTKETEQVELTNVTTK